MPSKQKLHRTVIACLGLPLLISYGDAMPDYTGKSPHEKQVSTNTSESQVVSRVKKIIAEQLGVKEDISNEASFVDDLGADSLDTVELVMALEEEFEIEIPDDEAEKIKTVKDAINYIESKLQHAVTSRKNSQNH